MTPDYFNPDWDLGKRGLCRPDELSKCSEIKVLAFYTTNITPADFSVPQVTGQLYACSGFGVKFKDLALVSLILTLY